MKEKVSYVVLIILLFLLIPFNVFAATIEYLGSTEGIISTNENFFSDFGVSFPGDIKEDFIEIKNSTDDEVEIFFKSESVDKNSDDLIEKLSLIISLEHNNEVKKIYEGNLKADKLNDYISLGNYKKGYNGKLLFKISIPTDLDNSYSNKIANFKWFFKVEDNNDENTDNSTIIIYENGKAISENLINNDSQEIRITSNSKTGDNIILYIIILCVTISILVLLVFVKLKNRKKDK